MNKKKPLLEKSPFAIDGKPMRGNHTALAGLCAFSRALRSLGVPKLCDDHIRIKERNNGFTVGQQVESLVLLHIAGGDCMQDIEQLRADAGLTKLLGYSVPSQRSIASFLESFHNPALIEKAREHAQERKQLSFIPEESVALAGLRETLRGLIRCYVSTLPAPVTRATVDQDATIIESAKQQAQYTYEGTRGYQPMVAAWAETGLIIADEFRDGNVPAISAPLECAKAAFAALPDTVTEYFFRGDSACHEHGLVNWLRNPNRPDGPQGTIAFAVSAKMSLDLRSTVERIHETRWKTFSVEKDGTMRQWVEVAFVPREIVEKKNVVPLRYIGLRILKPQGELFNDGSDRRHYAILTNRTEPDGGFILNWHREKAGTIEHVHEEVKNGLGGGQLPSAKFGANAAWFRIACIAFNVLVAVRRAWSDPVLHTAKAKRVRFMIVNVNGRVSHDARKVTLHLSATTAWIQRLLELFEHFPLATRPTR
jgi:hypothetical protein